MQFIFLFYKYFDYNYSIIEIDPEGLHVPIRESLPSGELTITKPYKKHNTIILVHVNR